MAVAPTACNSEISTSEWLTLGYAIVQPVLMVHFVNCMLLTTLSRPQLVQHEARPVYSIAANVSDEHSRCIGYIPVVDYLGDCWCAKSPLNPS